jgi:fucose permease
VLLALAITGGLAASLLLVLASGIFALGILGALLAGLCFGPNWPCALGIASQDASPRVPAILVTVGNAGGLFLPLIQGAVLDSAGPRAGMTITAALCIIMLLLVLGRRGATTLRTA